MEKQILKWEYWTQSAYKQQEVYSTWHTEGKER